MLLTFKKLSIFVLVFFSSQAFALSLNHETAPSYFDIEYLVDDSATLVLEDVVQNKAWQNYSNHFSFGYSSANYWLRLKLENDTQEKINPVLWLTETFFHEVTFYVKQDEKWQVVNSGLAVPVDERNIIDVFPHVQLALEKGETKDIYIKLNGEYGVFGSLMLSASDEFYSYAGIRSVFFMVILTALIMLAIFYLVMHLYLQQPSFVFYSLYALSFAIWLALYNGLIPMFTNEWVHSFLQVFMPLAFIFLIKFSQNILETEKFHSKFHSIMNVLVVFYVIAIIFIWIDVRYGFNIHNLLVTVTMPMLILVSLLALKRNNKMIRLYVIGLVIYFLGMTVLALMALGYLPYNQLTRNAPFPGSVIEFAIFAYILMLKIFQIQYEKQLAIQRYNDAQMGIQQQLETEVADRTLKLKQALSKKQEIILQYTNFLSLITHELRNPLGIIKSQITLMTKERNKGIDHCDQRLKTVSSTVQRMELLFDDWLVSDKLENNLYSVHLEAIELADWIKPIQAAMLQVYSSHKIQFECQSVNISVDAALLRLALNNLIDNAVKFSAPGSMIKVQSQVKNGQVLISVEDQGKGVLPELKELIFERFKRGDHQGIPGAGLGLSLVKSVMQLQGGNVYLDTSYQTGSRFVLVVNGDD